MSTPSPCSLNPQRLLGSILSAADGDWLSQSYSLRSLYLPTRPPIHQSHIVVHMSHYRPYVLQYPAGGSMQYAAAPHQLYPMPPSAGPSPLTSLSHPSAFTSSAYQSTPLLFSAPGTVQQQAINAATFAYNNATSQQLLYDNMQPIYQVARQPVQPQPQYIASRYPTAAGTTGYIPVGTVHRGAQDNTMLAYLVDYAVPASSSVAYSGYPRGYGSTSAANHGQDEALDTPDSPDSHASASPPSSPNVPPPPFYDPRASMSDVSTEDESPIDHDLLLAVQSAAAPIQRASRRYTKKATTIVMSGGVTKPQLTTEQKTCPVCNLTFKGNLTRHMAKHSKELQVLCDGCGGRFSRSDSLKRHLIRGSCKGFDDNLRAPREKENDWVVEQPDVPPAPQTKRKTTRPSTRSRPGAPPPVSHSLPAQSTMSPPADTDAAAATAVPADGKLSQEQLEAFIRIVNEMSGDAQSAPHPTPSGDGIKTQAP
ncbi:hypothetical protein BV22DRAFT_844823 [Leucogyrophana mollusca]|uniref:Uncharacterized protein n=1 Tax=Leucogyrophana mollusca TaxID=85980 RepID=A0ACB8B3V8_9AGAM|nr:hypothetical protein BV22DRAFT_844823 [Leucogyrophana mollusca]